MITKLKQFYWRLRQLKEVMRVFSNWYAYYQTFGLQDDGETLLRTRSGLQIAVRHNIWDIQIIREQFVDRLYLRHFHPPTGRTPIILDVGAYIGDFVLYSAHELDAQVIAYEPTVENLAMLKRNIKMNPAIADRITVVAKGISSTTQVLANVQIRGREIHVSSYWYADDPTAERRFFSCDSLAEALDNNGIKYVDLLKVDCEGGEYEIFPATSRDVYDRIGALVFEWHHVKGWEMKLSRVVESLEAAGFTLQQQGQLIYGYRQ